MSGANFDATRRRPGVLASRVGLAVLALTVLIGVFTVGAGSASAAAPQALILGSTVSPGTATDGSGVSLEQQGAQADGFTVTVVDDATWSSMTAAQFAAYQVIIIGDPTCGDTVSAGSVAQSNASVWEPVVMNSGGNKVLIGTDPTFHNDGPTGTRRGDLLEANGIAFAGAVPGATGAYVDLSCTYDSTPAGTPVPILDGLSTQGAGQFTAIGEGAVSACATGVNVVAQSGPTTGLTDADLSNWSCSVHEAFDKFPADYTPLALAPSSSGFPSSYCANDVGTGALACGSPYVMVSGSGVTVSSDISLAPPTQTLAVGSSATLTATVTNGGVPQAGKTVTFTVTSGPNVGATGTGVTDGSGQTTFTYPDNGGAGTDAIAASFVNDSGATEQATASVTWGAVASDPAITATGASGFSATEGAAATGTVATFTDPDTAATAGEYSATIDWGDGSTSTGTVSGSGGSFTVTGSHTYAEEGSHTITATITDVDNTANNASATTPATVADAALHASSTSGTLSGKQLSGTLATFTDDDPGGTLTDYTASVSWGDGASSAGTVSAGSGHFAVSASHTYGSTGTFTVTITIKDAGGSTVTTTSKVILASTPGPTGSAKLTGAPAACVLMPVNLSVKGKQIASVTWFVNGRKVKGRTVKRGTSYSVRIPVSAGAHHITVKVRFRKSSHTRSHTFHRTVSGCKTPPPKFTG